MTDIPDTGGLYLVLAAEDSRRCWKSAPSAVT